jgi:plastocyanin
MVCDDVKLSYQDTGCCDDSTLTVPLQDVTIDHDVWWDYDPSVGFVGGNLTIEIGSTVNFYWSSTHNLRQTASYDCDSTILTTLVDNQASVNYSTTFNQAGTFYYICNMGNGVHCTGSNQRIAITVTDSVSPTTPVITTTVATNSTNSTTECEDLNGISGLIFNTTCTEVECGLDIQTVLDSMEIDNASLATLTIGAAFFGIDISTQTTTDMCCESCS